MLQTYDERSFTFILFVLPCLLSCESDRLDYETVITT